MTNCISVLILFCVFMNAYFINAQAVTVIYMQGDIKTSAKARNKSGFSEKTVNLGYGPIGDWQSLTLAGNAKVKLIKDDGYQCEVSGPGTFLINDLKFEKIEEKATLTSFLDYFKSFFVAHPNSESKENYSNSIAAISKGEMVMPPLLSFPFPGVLPLMKKELTFSWEVSCDTCTYVLVIQDLANKQIILQEETNQHSYKLKNPEKHLVIGKKYLWLIEIKHSDIKSVSQLFTIADPKDYKLKIYGLEKSFNADNPYLTPVTQMISIFSALEKEKLVNYMILYGQDQINKHPKDAALKDINNRVYYDNLKRRRI